MYFLRSSSKLLWNIGVVLLVALVVDITDGQNSGIDTTISTKPSTMKDQETPKKAVEIMEKFKLPKATQMAKDFSGDSSSRKTPVEPLKPFGTQEISKSLPPHLESVTTQPVEKPGQSVLTLSPNQQSSSLEEHREVPMISQEKSFSTDEVTVPPMYNFTGYSNKTDETHDYYNSTVITNEEQAKALWIELDNLNDTVSHDMLSDSYRRAATVNLTFSFPFYGHPIDNVTIATGGFLYVGYKLHMWLAATQYIAPLMANFKASAVDSNSSLKYYDNGTVFVVEWRNVCLEDDVAAKPFTFQTSLHKNGDIYFVYKKIPKNISEIQGRIHPVKVGISDAYMFKRIVHLFKRKTIYEYHSVDKRSDAIRTNSAIVLRALPTCLSLKTCEECTVTQINFNCTWCEAVQRCSSGLDRYRQEWLNGRCDENITPKEHCMAADARALAASSESSSSSSTSTGGAGFTALFIILSIVLVIGIWVIHAFRNPRSPSGQFLIKYRPSQWKRHGEARYIAAGSLHM